jgi:hypothetical protein
LYSFSIKQIIFIFNRINNHFPKLPSNHIVSIFNQSNYIIFNRINNHFSKLPSNHIVFIFKATTLYLSKWFCDTSTGAATGAAHCGSFVGGDLVSWSLAMDERGRHEDLRGSGRQSVIPCVHGRTVLHCSSLYEPEAFFLTPVKRCLLDPFIAQGRVVTMRHGAQQVASRWLKPYTAVWSHPVNSPCYTEHDKRFGAVLSGRIIIVAMFRSSQLGLRCSVELNCSGMSTRVVGASVTHDRALDTCEPSYVPGATRPFFIPVVHNPLGGVGMWQHRSSPLGEARSGPHGNAGAHLGREARSRAEEHVAAPELSSRGGRARSHGTCVSAGAHLDREVRSGAGDPGVPTINMKTSTAGPREVPELEIQECLPSM